jgi:hypothetical protein
LFEVRKKSVKKKKKKKEICKMRGHLAVLATGT